MEPPASVPPPPIEPFRIERDEVWILDQTLLPGEERWIQIQSVEDVWEAIKMLRVRGAPAIGIAAAYGLAIAARASNATSREELLRDLARAREYLESARPTAVNLTWALKRVYNRAALEESDDPDRIREAVRAEADAIRAEDLAVCRKIGEIGAALLDGGSVLTHCNAGSLATAGYGTALSAIYVAHEQGKSIHVYVDETRPLLQGSRLTAWELSRAGIDATLIADNMAATVLARGDVRAVIVGADRVAANGDVANKIGTFNVAILARTFGVPFYVAVPTSTIDFDAPDGASIPIEERDPSEIARFNGRDVAPLGVKIFNPAFDITPAEYVTAFITERGIIMPPFAENLARLRTSAG